MQMVKRIQIIFAICFLSTRYLQAQTNHHNLEKIVNRTESFKMSQINPNFQIYKDSLIPTWIISDSNVSTIHRFFDSSPFSPTGRYLALTRSSENIRVSEGSTAEIVLYDLILGSSSGIHLCICNYTHTVVDTSMHTYF
jgi:hypothetical protein